MATETTETEAEEVVLEEGPAEAEEAPPAPAGAAPEAPGEETENSRRNRKVREGVVRSAKMEKTAVVEVTRRSRHPQYSKTVQHAARYYVHDEENTLRAGDRVRIVETRPLSKKKRWRLLEVLERAR